MSDKKRKIAIVTGSRGEYGYIRPIIRVIEKDPDLAYELIVTNMHLLDEFGYSLNEIKKDNLKVGAKIINTFDGYNPVSMAKSLSVFLLQLPEVLEAMQPDFILLAGDRGEQLMAAIAGAHLNIPVAHIQAGELSGNIDGMTRHAITKFAHLHFASSPAAAKRVLDMGEQGFRVHEVGASQLDELCAGNFTSSEEIAKKYHLNLSLPIILMAQHPVTEQFAEAAKQIEETLEAVVSLGLQTVVIMSNSDAGSKAISGTLLRYRRPNVQMHRNVSREDYAGLMKVASVIVGNSSSGLIEAPVFGLPAVNIGRRQEGREQAANVINVSHERTAIREAVLKALTPEWREKCRSVQNPYGDGKSSERIVNILKNTPINEELIIKKLSY